MNQKSFKLQFLLMTVVLLIFKFLPYFSCKSCECLFIEGEVWIRFSSVCIWLIPWLLFPILFPFHHACLPAWVKYLSVVKSIWLESMLNTNQVNLWTFIILKWLSLHFKLWKKWTKESFEIIIKCSNIKNLKMFWN